MPTYEDRLPPWQRSVNRFAENWIFAFMIAMAIRHFGVEAFRIPTASMEPMLYGDPAFLRSDHVIVDKLTVRFRPVRRWDVTVFQFPHPEIENRGEPQSALRYDDQRRDNLLTRPLMYRNFVKRAVVVPGDVFYLANGDLFLGDAQGGFAIARKPEAIQEALWQEIYCHDAQPGYVPWRKGDASLAADGARLAIAPAGGDVTFAQSLRNLYIKPGIVWVQGPRGAGEQVNVAMTRPLFTLSDGRTGNIWDLDQWTVTRLTSADIDKPTQGKDLNAYMRERVGDLRIRAEIAAIDGPVSLRLSEGAAQVIAFELTPTGWSLSVTTPAGSEVRASGAASLAGHRVALASIDDQLVLTIDGAEQHRSDLAAVDPDAQPSAIAWTGTGTLALAALAIDRDVHYCANGFLADESERLKRVEAEIRNAERSLDDSSSKFRAEGSGGPSDKVQRTQVTRDGLDALSADRRHLVNVRASMPTRTTVKQGAAIGQSPETAITAPADAYLLLGDNSPLSWDSRNWGWVPGANLRGRVVCRARTRWWGKFPLPFGDWSVVR